MNSFFAVIDELNSCSALERPALEARILRDFEQERAVLALDMSGYSFSVRRGGILPHLCRIRRMQQAATPLVERFGGEVVKQVADNILAIFREPRHAIDAAVAINQAVAASRAGEACDDSALLSVGIGIDFGSILCVPHDCFGDAVNIAYKLGEDVARGDEILITDSARERLAAAPHPFRLEELQLFISGVELVAYEVLYR